MNNQRSLIASTVNFSLEGLQKGALMLPHSHDRSAYGRILIPIVVLKRGVGPTVLLTGGNHGDELEGPIALMKLIQRMSTLEISGRLIIVPGLNFPAFHNGTRTSPIDQGNLNRLFPGNRSGSITEMIAHYVDTELFPISEVILDMHAGGASFQHAPALLASLPGYRSDDTYVSYREGSVAAGIHYAVLFHVCNGLSLCGKSTLFEVFNYLYLYVNYIYLSIDLLGVGVFQNSCRVSRLTMPLVSRTPPLDQGSTSQYLLAPSYGYHLTSAPGFCAGLARTVHGAGPGSDDPALGAAAPV